MKSKNLVGQRFGRLVVLERTRHNGKVAWKCQCDCGNKSVVTTYCLTHKTISCGCYRYEKWKESQDKISRDAEEKKKIDLLGKRLGKLLVKSYNSSTDKYICECTCGSVVSRARSTLLYGGRRNIHCCDKCVGDAFVNDTVGKRFGILTVVASDRLSNL